MRPLPQALLLPDSGACLPRGDSAEAHPEGNRGTHWSRTAQSRWHKRSSVSMDPGCCPWGGPSHQPRVGQWADMLSALAFTYAADA